MSVYPAWRANSSMLRSSTHRARHSQRQVLELCCRCMQLAINTESEAGEKCSLSACGPWWHRSRRCSLIASTACLILGFRPRWRVNPPTGEWRNRPGGGQKRFVSKASTTSHAYRSSSQLRPRWGPVCRHGASLHDSRLTHQYSTPHAFERRQRKRWHRRRTDSASLLEGEAANRSETRQWRVCVERVAAQQGNEYAVLRLR